MDWGSILTGGIIGEGGDQQDAAGLLSGYGPVKSLLGATDLPNNYDSKGELAKSEAMAGAVYQDAMGQSQWIADHQAPGLFGQGAAIKEQTIQAPGAIKTGTIDAQRIETSPLLQGQQADQLRQQQLDQAQAAANSPSSAAAQMRAAQGQITQQQLGQAAMARGPERAAMRRDAMLASGTQGMQAANSTAALAAQENMAKQQAYTGALGSIRAGDVSGGQALTQVGAQNQQADLAAKQATAANQLQAQVATGAQGLTAAQANQAANLRAQQQTFANTSQGWQNQVNAQNQAAGTALQAVGAQNQAQGVASGYATEQNQAATQNKGALMGAVSGVIGGLLSDEMAKTDIVKSSGTVGSQDFLAWKPEPPPKQEENKGLLGSLLSDETAKTEKRKAPSMADKTTSKLRAAFGLDSRGPLGGEAAKEAVDDMTPEERIDWAEKVPTGTWRYKPGFEDGGAEPHAGTFAHALENTGPLGQMFVHERPDGLDEVEYGPLALMVAKAALDKAGKKEAR